MSNYHFQMVHRRALNLKQSLVIADLKLIDISIGSGPCGKPCLTCPYMERTTTKQPQRERHFRDNSDVD